jgi:hypothetical protein
MRKEYGNNRRWFDRFTMTKERRKAGKMAEKMTAKGRGRVVFFTLKIHGTGKEGLK